MLYGNKPNVKSISYRPENTIRPTKYIENTFSIQFSTGQNYAIFASYFEKYYFPTATIAVLLQYSSLVTPSVTADHLKEIS